MSDENAQTSQKYLVYQLGTQVYATPLIEVREVIEFREAKPIPHTSAFFKGVINIRGEIIGVLDLRERLNIPDRSPQPMAQLIFETDEGPLAATVDLVHSVIFIPEIDLERKPALGRNEADRPYLIGVGKVDDKLLTVISLRKVLTPEQLLDLSGPQDEA